MQGPRPDSRTFAWRLLSAAAIGVAVMVATPTVAFIYQQSTSMLRNLFLHPLVVLALWPIGVLVAGVAFLRLRNATARHCVVSVVILVLTLVAWWAVQRSPVSDWLLPEATTK